MGSEMCIRDRYMSFAGDLDLAIAIRTGVMRAGTLTVYAGAGIVADSDPESELTESKNKAASVLNAGAAANTLGSVGTRGEDE